MMHASHDVVVRLLERAELNGLGPSAPVMKDAASEILSLRREVAVLSEALAAARANLTRYEKLFGAA